jgi:predicted TIM-barrel fold metal-dependent hydrolase
LEDVVQTAVALLGLAAVALDPTGHEVEHLGFQVHGAALCLAAAADQAGILEDLDPVYRSGVTYAGEHRIVDADSHVMETATFLTDHADPHVRDRLPPVARGRSRLDLDVAPHTGDERSALLALGDGLIRHGPKWHAALGAMDSDERSQALDLLGFEHQVVYSSLCSPLFDIGDPDLRYGAYRAHNRAMAAFCGDDPRLVGVAMCDLDDVGSAVGEIEAAFELGLGLVWLPARAPGGRSPGHPDHDSVWERLAERRTPFVLHVGSGQLGIGDAWMNDGRTPTEQGVGAEIIGSKDFMVVYQPAERFLSVLVLDGVLERHPGLRGGAIEMGADWVPAMLRRLDHAVAIWSRSEPRLGEFARTPSEQAAAQLRFTPYPFEDVGGMSRDADPRLFLFSSDYPHAEGGRDPLSRFDRSLAGAAPDVIDGFYATNALEWLGSPS